MRHLHCKIQSEARYIYKYQLVSSSELAVVQMSVWPMSGGGGQCHIFAWGPTFLSISMTMQMSDKIQKYSNSK